MKEKKKKKTKERVGCSTEVIPRASIGFDGRAISASRWHVTLFLFLLFVLSKTEVYVFFFRDMTRNSLPLFSFSVSPICSLSLCLSFCFFSRFIFILPLYPRHLYYSGDSPSFFATGLQIFVYLILWKIRVMEIRQ